MGQRCNNLRMASRRLPRALSYWLFVAGLLVAHGALGAESQSLQQLAKPISITWQQVPLHTALQRLGDAQSLAIWCDRRIDPGALITLTAVDRPTAEVFASLGEQLGAAAVPFVGVIYFGPPQTCVELATLAALARQPLSGAPATVRARWLKPQPWTCDRLSEPRELLRQLASAAHANIRGEQLVPHDLWPARKLPAMAPLDCAVLLLAGFDLACEPSNDGEILEIKPIDRPVAIAQEYRVPSSQSAAFDAAVAALPEATSSGDGSRPTIVARVEDHQRLRAALSGRSTGAVAAAAAALRSGAANVAGSELEDRRFTLTIENKPLTAVLNQLATQLDLQLEWDAAIPATAADRNVLVSCKVAKADLDGLLEALLEPAGLTCERQQSRVLIRKR
ncbi:hypothetical protein [Lacipirellula limnantheis]|nr:hypothetical protein [Lacipirellula limnantheis]